MSETLVDRVRQVLISSGLTQSQFAEQIGIDGPKLTKSLNGKRRFTSFELAAIAERGNETVDWLLSGRNRTRLFAYRAAEASLEHSDAIGRQKIDLIDDRVSGLAFLGRPINVPALPVTTSRGRYIDQGAKAAAKYVSVLDSELNTLSTAALIDRLEAKLGVNIVIADLPDGCDGLSFARDELRVIVLATSKTAPYRQRFTLAHELGHLAFGDASDSVIEETLYVRTDVKEKRANAFAAHFLASAPQLQDAIGERTPSDAFDELVLDFQLSPDAMAWRLYNEGLISEDQRIHLGSDSARTVALRAGRAAEHAARIDFAAQERPPLRLVGAYLSAYADGEATLQPAASLLGWSLERVEETFGESATLEDIRLITADTF